jgi:L-malate glycosyltransferase
VATSASEAEVARTLDLGRRGRIVTIPNGIDLTLPPVPMDLRTALSIPADAPLVGSISRLVPQKAPEDLVAAFAVVAARRPDAHFVVIGGGELEAEVEAAVDQHALRARFHRIDSLDGAGGVLGQLDVFALASRFEGGPYAPLEAMRAATPVVLTDVVGSRDAIIDGASGRLVAPGRPAELGAAIAALLDDPAERQRLGAGGRARVAEHFDVRAMGAALDALYSDLVAAASSGR